jgi:hypothetical protein
MRVEQSAADRFPAELRDNGATNANSMPSGHANYRREIDNLIKIFSCNASAMRTGFLKHDLDVMNDFRFPRPIVTLASMIQHGFGLTFPQTHVVRLLKYFTFFVGVYVSHGPANSVNESI